MPITLPPISRRRFLAGGLAAGAATLAGRLPWGWGADGAGNGKLDPHRFALLSDPHVNADRSIVFRGANMFDNLRQASDEVLKLDSRPANVLLNGDFAHIIGTVEDYATALEGVKPLREAGLPVHLTLGNHDHRERFWKAVPDKPGAERPVEGRHLTVVESPRANWILLDSLDVTNKSPGVLGAAQLAWLVKALDARADKPALVMVHHDPDEREKPSGITDTKALYEVLSPRKQVKLLVFGHTHNWTVKKRDDGIHLANLPPVGYVFAAGKPNGWVDAKLAERGATLELRCIDPKHTQHGLKVELEWR